eukprot:TRINITY_DN1843_c0_g1_i1.p1 TRINITY_DN1843_c0_g1~~TRINITY_DN1843_c0_g1_i1.p1  ORF type:complete len:485 (-),score=145.87 TRINITY_DN1843_c0_g1_i1:259-1713(-)
MSKMDVAMMGAAAIGAATLAKTAFVSTGLTSSSAPADAQPTVAALRGAAVGQEAALPAAGSGVTGALAGSVAVAAVAGAAARRRQRSGRQSTVVSVAARGGEAPEDYSEVMPDCPRTIWNADNIDINNLPDVKETSPLIINAADLGDALKKGAEEEWFAENRKKIEEQLMNHGAIWFRGFDMMKDAAGFRKMFEALQLNPCLDPIHTSGLRAYQGKKDAIYDAVNKPGLAGHIVGMHNESTYVKTAKFGAFVCFKKAEGGGGEFTLADGAKVIAGIDKEVLKRIYEKKVRISVTNLDLNFINALPSDELKQSARNWLSEIIFGAVAPKFQMDLEMIYNADNSNPNRLQAIEHAQPPINTHPVTGQPVWFCNLHNHSRYLRDRRPCTVPEFGMTDVYYGDLSKIPATDVMHINEVMEKNIVEMMMEPGDVVLLDNYRVLHGRKTFKGERNHAVTWFESMGEPATRETEGRADDFMNTLVNKTLVN